MINFIIKELFVRSWWVFAFLIFCAVLFEQGLKERDRHYQQLDEQLQSLKFQKNEALHKQEDLQRQINSQSDLAWIELTLMKGLGLVPDGEEKVYFYR
ncbi:MAG: hypothetical protein H0V82_03010 [Candidatus Protochlamydia sp.]|nr:hypothetical protein [Candidatus Protochlamydia sp.]